MQTAASRLREARERAGFRNVKEGAARVAVSYPTYAGHENGNRAYSVEDAVKYGKAFHVRPEWLLYGNLGPERITDSDAPQQPLPPVVKAIEDCLDGLTESEQRTIADVVKLQRGLFRPEES